LDAYLQQKDPMAAFNAFLTEISELGGNPAPSPTLLGFFKKLIKKNARQAMFHYIELFYNPRRRHTSNGQLSPIEYDRQYFRNLESV
tara:strand:- start:352 stop:612 length:261 start_codon:yes stop_codon:yes gene_type:complete